MIKTLKYLIISIAILLLGCTKNDSTESVNNDQSIQLNPKKGACITTKNNGWNLKVKSLNVSWHYSWGDELTVLEPEKVEFVPMIWGAWSDTAKVQQKLNYILSLKKQGKVNYLLGFNEPDNADQANMSVETAIKYWPKLQAVGLKLGSPACVNPTGDWMKSFMNEADKRNLQIDFVCVHWYGGASASSFLSRLKEVYDLYKRPIWITEFAPADWTATSPEKSKFTKLQILNFMKEVLPALDNLNYIGRYAWFSASETSAPLGNAALFDSNGQLTELGKFYADFQGKTN